MKQIFDGFFFSTSTTCWVTWTLNGLYSFSTSGVIAPLPTPPPRWPMGAQSSRTVNMMKRKTDVDVAGVEQRKGLWSCGNNSAAFLMCPPETTQRVLPWASSGGRLYRPTYRLILSWSLAWRRRCSWLSRMPRHLHVPQLQSFLIL